MIKVFAVSLSIALAFHAYSNDLIRYYDGKLKLGTSEIDSLCNSIIRDYSEGYLLALALYQKAVLMRQVNKNFEAFEHYNHAANVLQSTDTVDSFLESAIFNNQGVIR